VQPAGSGSTAAAAMGAQEAAAEDILVDVHFPGLHSGWKETVHFRVSFDTLKKELIEFRNNFCRTKNHASANNGNKAQNHPAAVQAP